MACLTISDLSSVVEALSEVTTPYQLGIRLKIDTAVLKGIEDNYPRDNVRQKTEVIEYWLRNSRDASWSTLADAVERMGGHARLVERLRERVIEQDNSFCIPWNPKFKSTKQVSEASKVSTDPSQQGIGLECVLDSVYLPLKFAPNVISLGIPLDRCVDRDVLLLGKLGHGKSTLGNRVLHSDGCLKINNEQCPLTCTSSSVLKSASQCQNYHITVIDHDGLFEGTNSINDALLKRLIVLHLVIFVLKRGCCFEVEELDILRAVVNEWNIRTISALVLTHCERLSEEEREKVIEQFKKDHPSVAELMGKGILAVGFPDRSHVEPRSVLSQRVEEDKRKLKQLIYSCYARVFIRSPSPPPLGGRTAIRPPYHPPQNHRRFKMSCSLF